MSAPTGYGFSCELAGRITVTIGLLNLVAPIGEAGGGR